MMKRFCLLLIVGAMFTAVSWADTLDFSSPSVEPVGASLSYTGGAASLDASGIGIVSVSDLTTSLSTTCFGCTLSFATGSNTGGWTWGAGGNLDIVGSAGTASGTLLSGTITSASIVACGGATCIDVNTFINSVNASLQNFFGINPADPNWSGSSSLNIVLSGAAGSAFSLSNKQIGSGDLTTTGAAQSVPEPATLLLLGCGLLGLMVTVGSRRQLA